MLKLIYVQMCHLPLFDFLELKIAITTVFS